MSRSNQTAIRGLYYFLGDDIGGGIGLLLAFEVDFFGVFGVFLGVLPLSGFLPFLGDFPPSD